MQDKLSKELKDELTIAARDLRKNPTPAEIKLWKQLRNGQIEGHKFRRQHIIHTFIVDFYCASAKLIIELDGEIHAQQQDYDTERDKFLAGRAYQILRFPNDAVLYRIETVLEQIKTALAKP